MQYLVRRFSRMLGCCVVIATAVAIVAPPSVASAATRPPAGAVIQLGTRDWLTTSAYGGWNWASPDDLSYYADSAGNLAIVSHDADNLTIDTFDPSTMKRVGGMRSVSHADWPRWGGFYAGADGCLYVLLGRDNLTQSDTLDVVAVRRYDRNWTLLGTAYVQGGITQGWPGIYIPFEASAPHMLLVGDRLVVHMARLMYDDGWGGVHHQLNLTFEVNVETMTATPFAQLGGYAYCGHSFQQLVAMNGSNLVMIDHGDAYPRVIQMGVMAGYPTQRSVSTYALFEFNGAVGNNFTGATVNGLASGPQGVVVLGTSIRQPNAPNGTLGSGSERRNVYAIWADPATGEHAVRWLTAFAPTGTEDALEPRVVQVGPDRYAVLFSVEKSGAYRMEYRLIDSAGTVLVSKSFPGVFFCAGSDPIMIGNTVYWAGVAPDSWDSPEPYYLFGVDVSDPTTPILLSSVLDFMAPYTSSNRAAYYATSATIHLTASDNASGSGVVHTYYRLNGAAQVEGTTITKSTAGSYSLEFWSEDVAGNVETPHTVTFIVIAKPSSSGTPSIPAPIATLRHGRSFTVSGYVVKHTAGTSPITLQFYRYQSGHWVLRKSTTAKASNMLTFSKYSDSTSVPYSGKWRVRARHKVGSHYHYSGYRTFTAS